MTTVIDEAPVELINVPMTDSSTLITVIKDCQICLILPIRQCRGQAYDGASNMAGGINGATARIQNDEPSAIYSRVYTSTFSARDELFTC